MANAMYSSTTSSSGAAGVGPVNQEQQSGRISGVFPEEGKIRELAEQIRTRFVRAHQLKVAIQQQQQATAAINMQISQAEEMSKRLKETIGKLQEAVRDYSLTGLYERLGVITKKLNLKIDLQQSRTPSIFLISDAFFYIEVCCQDNGSVTTVKLAQANTSSEDSAVLTKLLQEHNFAEFETHIQSLVSLYSNATTTNVTNVYKALGAMENVLTQISRSSPRVALMEMIMKNPLGHLTQRNGGLPMYMTFFVHPYEVLKNPAQFKSKQEVSIDVGMAVKMLVAKSTQRYQVSIDPNLFNFSTATFFAMTHQNSVVIPLTFMVELTKSIPVSVLIRERFQVLFGAEQPPVTQVSNLHINQLISQSKARQEGKEVLTDKWRLVCLPNQYHYYLMPSELRSRDQLHDLKPQDCGVMLSSVTFVHPGHIFQVLLLLRKQLTYNALLSSCLGRSKKGVPLTKDVSEYIFELNSVPPSQIAVVMDTQDSTNEKKITVEFILPDQSPTEPLVQVKIGEAGMAVPQPKLAEVVKRCLSIPVTLQAALKYPTQLLDSETANIVQHYHMAVEAFNATLASTGDQGDNDGGGLMEGLDDGRSLIGMKRKRTD